MAGSTFAEISLGDIADFRNGKAISPERYTPVGRHPVFGSNGQIARSDDVLNQQPVIVIGRVGAYCGCVHYVPRASWVTDNAIVAVPKEGNNLRYLFYLLGSLELQRTAIGSAQPLMTQGGLKAVRTKAPPLAEQKAIALILGTLDDKIDLNRRMNATLETLAQTLFKNWFVEAAATKLPQGWRAGMLGEVAENPRRSIQPDEIKSAMCYIGLEHMPRRCITLSEWESGTKLESNKLEFKRLEILFGKLRPYFHKVGVAPLDGVCSTDILVVRPKTPEWFGFVLGHVSSAELVNHTDAASTGTKMPRTNWNDIARFEVALPPETLAAEFTATIRPMIDRIIANIHESRTLAELRDALLPKLLSGKLRVPVAANSKEAD
ncbi:MAG: restriction endonuclease subunit S [Limisphaerales bacterium]